MIWQAIAQVIDSYLTNSQKAKDNLSKNATDVQVSHGGDTQTVESGTQMQAPKGGPGEAVGKVADIMGAASNARKNKEENDVRKDSIDKNKDNTDVTPTEEFGSNKSKIGGDLGNIGGK